MRARRRDILDLATRFLAEDGRGVAYRFSHHLAEALLLHPWPHNIRELRSTMQRLALLQPGGGELSRRAIEDILGPDTPAPARARAATLPARGPAREELVERLTALRGNVNRIAAHYGKDPKQIYRWLRRHKLDPADYR